MQIQTKKALKHTAVIIVLCCIISAIGLPIYLTWLDTKEPKACPYLATPVTFHSVTLKKIGEYRNPSLFPVATFSYSIQGKQYTSKRVFCTDSGAVKAERTRVQAFVADAEKAEPIVAWIKPDKPETGCISINSEFGYSTSNNISKQCLAK